MATTFRLWLSESGDGLQADRFYLRAGKPFKLIQDTGSVDGAPARKAIAKLTQAQKRQAEAALVKADTRSVAPNRFAGTADLAEAFDVYLTQL